MTFAVRKLFPSPSSIVYPLSEVSLPNTLEKQGKSSADIHNTHLWLFFIFLSAYFPSSSLPSAFLVILLPFLTPTICLPSVIQSLGKEKEKIDSFDISLDRNLRQPLQDLHSPSSRLSLDWSPLFSSLSHIFTCMLNHLSFSYFHILDFFPISSCPSSPFGASFFCEETNILTVYMWILIWMSLEPHRRVMQLLSFSSSASKGKKGMR